jgi:hypothetical protein
MKISEVGGLLGYSQERAEKLIYEGLALPKSGNIVILRATRVAIGHAHGKVNPILVAPALAKGEFSMQKR